MVARSYSTRGSEKKMLENAMKLSKSSTNRRIRLKKVIVVKKEKNVKVVEISEGEDIDLDVVAVTEKIR